MSRATGSFLVNADRVAYKLTLWNKWPFMASNSGENRAASKIRAAEGLNLSGLKTAAVRIYPTPASNPLHCQWQQEPQQSDKHCLQMCWHRTAVQWPDNDTISGRNLAYRTETDSLWDTYSYLRTRTYQGLSPEEYWPGGDTEPLNSIWCWTLWKIGVTPPQKATAYRAYPWPSSTEFEGKWLIVQWPENVTHAMYV